MLCFVALFLVFLFFTTGLPGTCYYHARTLPQKVYGHMGVFSPSKNAVYLFGGLTGTEFSNNQFVYAIFKWDLNVVGSWFEYIGTPYDSGATQFIAWNNNAVLVGDLVYFIGIGVEGGGATDEMFVYDLNTDSFSSQSRARAPTASVAGCLTTNGTHIFMVDGRDFTGSLHPPFLYVYDVAGDAWQSHQLSMGVTTTGGYREQYCSFVGDLLYVAGGNTDGQGFDEVFSIDVRTLQTQLLGTLPQANSGGGTVLINNASMYMVGGWKMSTDAIAFNIATDEVTTAFQTQVAFSSAVVLAINNQIYRFGGMDNVPWFASDKVEICDFSTPTSEPTSGPTTSTPTTAATTTTGPTTAGPTTSTSTTTTTTTESSTNAPTTATPTSNPIDVNVSFSTNETSSSAPSQDPTANPSHSSYPPSLPEIASASSEFGVDITVRFADELPQNEAQIVIAGLSDYALQETATTTVDCAEIVDNASHAESPNQLIILSIFTCSQSTENELFVAFDDDSRIGEFETLIASLTDVDVDDIEIQRRGGQETTDAPDPEKAQSSSPVVYVWVGIICGLACACILCCGLLVFVYRERRWLLRTKSTHDEIAVAAVGEQPPGLPQPLPPQPMQAPPPPPPPPFPVGVMRPPPHQNVYPQQAQHHGYRPQPHMHPIGRGFVPPAPHAFVPPAPPVNAIQMVQHVNIRSASSLSPSDSESDDEADIYKTQSGMPTGTGGFSTRTSRSPRRKKRKGPRKQKGEHQERKDDEAMFAQLLRAWGLEEFTTVFRDNGWTEVAAWSGQYLTVKHLQDMGLKPGHIATFQRKCNEVNGGMQAWYGHNAMQVGQAPMMMMGRHPADDSGQHEDMYGSQRTLASEDEGNVGSATRTTVGSTHNIV